MLYDKKDNKREPKKETIKKVIIALKNTKQPLSKRAIQNIANVDWNSLLIILGRLIKQGRVKVIHTSAGSFYQFKNISGDGNE